MFSGIITHIGHVEKVEKDATALRLTLQTGMTDLEEGESVAVNGVCLTVETRNETGKATFFLSSETLDRSSLGRLTTDSKVNLERALAVNARLSGHIVQGHVDGKATLIHMSKINEAHEIKLFIPQDLRRYFVPKGSVCLDGVSLTINQIEDRQTYKNQEGFYLSIMLVPHTWEHTAFHMLKIFDEMNVETDIIGRYVETMLLFPPERHAQ
ncbi:riboflavin synthase [Acetobacteraceae bacterium]|nr:riboflavin synthase [Acetobacteraceae bacterium]